MEWILENVTSTMLEHALKSLGECGPIEPASIEVSNILLYSLTSSAVPLFYLLKEKSTIIDVHRKFKARIKLQSDCKFKILRFEKTVSTPQIVQRLL